MRRNGNWVDRIGVERAMRASSSGPGAGGAAPPPAPPASSATSRLPARAQDARLWAPDGSCAPFILSGSTGGIVQADAPLTRFVVPADTIAVIARIICPSGTQQTKLQGRLEIEGSGGPINPAGALASGLQTFAGPGALGPDPGGICVDFLIWTGPIECRIILPPDTYQAMIRGSAGSILAWIATGWTFTP